MNGLNLRISGEKKKKSLKRETKEDLNCFITKHEIEKLPFDDIKEFLGAHTTEKQVTAIKLIMKNVNSHSYYPEEEKIIQFCLDIFLSVGMKSPLKIPILRLLMSTVDDLKPLVQKNIEIQLKHRFSNSGSDPEVISEFVSTLVSCFEHSDVNHLSIGCFKNDLSKYLENTIQTFHPGLKDGVPPIQKLSLINCIHTCVRCYIVLLQKTDYTPTAESFYLIVNLLKDNEIPLDTRTICGILCVMIYKLLNHGFNWNKLDTDIGSSDQLTQLCVMSGMLTALEVDDLSSVEENSDSNVFTEILKKIISIEHENSADCTFVLGSSRCLALVSKCLASHPVLMTPYIFELMLPSIWLHLEHYMDAVRHLASSTLAKLVAASKTDEKSYITEIIARDISKISVEKRSKNAALTALIGHIPIKDLLKSSPGLIECLLQSAKNSSGVNHVISSLESLLTQHYKEKLNINEWYSLWILPLLDAISEKPNAALEHVLTAAIKLHPDVILYVGSLQKEMSETNCGIYLLCLRVGRKFGLIQGVDDSEKWKGFIEFKTLSNCMINSNDEIRISCLALVIETQKTSEEYTESEFGLIKLFLKNNIKNQNPAVRQKGFAFFKKFIIRFKDGLAACERKINKENQNENTNIKKSTIYLYNTFMEWLINFCISNLFPGSNFSRRCTAFNLLTLCADYGFWTDSFQKESYVKPLLICLLDSYEANKILAKNLLKRMPAAMLGFDDLDYVKQYLKHSLLLASSIRPPDSISAAYFISLLASFKELGKYFFEISQNKFDFPIDSEPEFSVYACLMLLLDALKKELEVAQSSILRASCSGPMYGLIFVIRHLLQDTPLSCVQDSDNWKSLIENIIITSYKCDEAVSFIVNNTSPEGLLPMDLDYDVSQLGNTTEVPQVTSQMVLLCCWRTVKEVSLLLGELSEKAPISSEDCKGLITENQILSIGEHLTALLAETKHRGAFEQAYVGFCKLASRLWRYPKGNLHKLPSQWLNETLSDIATKTNLSATRRSAGIPFIVQGLVCTEMEVGGGKCFHKGIKTLLKLAQEEQYTGETRVHALNILRALFRHSLLGEMVSPYAAEGLALAIQGYNSNTWAERNSSTLLLSALMVRIFGVPRSNDSENLSWKNKMTGRIFFQRYPSLFGVLYKHLESASNTNLYPAIYPALLILGRLYPSSLEGTDSNLQLSKFIPYVSDCAGSSILKTRSLAASAMVALITPNIFSEHINKIFENIFISRNENLTHGLLLQALKLLRNIPNECKTQITTRIPVWVLVLSHILESGKHSYVVKECCLKMLITFVTCFFEYLPEENWKKLVALLEINLFYPDSIIDIVDPAFGCSGFLLHASILLMYLCYKMNLCESLVENILKLLDHKEYLVYQSALNFTISILKSYSHLIYDDLNDVDPLSLNVVETNMELKRLLTCSEALAMIIVNKLDQNCHFEDKKLILKAFRCLLLAAELFKQRHPLILQYFIKFFETETELISAQALDCVTPYIECTKGIVNSKEFAHIFDMLMTYSDATSDYECRHASNKFFIRNYEEFINTSSENAFYVWISLYKLLNDDEAEIRDSICKRMVGNIVQTKCLEVYFERLYNSTIDDLIKAGILLALALGDCSLEEEELGENTDRVFDKGDSNSYNEELVTNHLSCLYLHNVLKNESLVKENISPILISWIEKYHGDLTGKSIEEIVDNIKKNLSSSLKSKTISPFRPMEIKLLIQEKKLANILDSIRLSEPSGELANIFSELKLQ